MRFTFLGTGTSQGVPPIAYEGGGLNLACSKNWRTRASAHVEMGGKHIQIDAGPEFRMQCLNCGITWIDVFLLTHGHADHIAGMDDLRRFCDRTADNVIDVYSNAYGLERIAAMFPYAMKGKPTERGYPCFNTHSMPEVLDLGDAGSISSVVLPHGPVESLGFVFASGGKKIAYYTDCKSLPERALELADGADALVLDALKLKKHPSHLTIYEAIEYAEKIGAKTTYFTHTTCHIDYCVWEDKLPAGMHIAYDGLVFEV